MTRVLVVEDDAKVQANLLFQLREEGLAPTAVGSAEAALAELEGGDGPPDLLLLDVRLPGMSGVELVRRLAAAGRLPPTVIISGEATISETVEALRLGVHDFIEKPLGRERLRQSIRNALEHTALRRQVARLESELADETELLGDSAALAEVRRLVAQAAPTDARVLIVGESGTGKELVADALHRQSRRRDKPFIKVNCAAIPDHLIEDELFGHVRGAFTDARADKAGLFEEADGGTLFLDEIGDMEYSLQSRLLRVLEDGQVRRVGGTREHRVDVRVIAATHADLEKLIEERRFREDLYYRLAGVPLRVPPLREHREDVRPLFDHFLARFTRRHRARPRSVEPEVYARLEAHDWPGNVRELRNLSERLVVLAGDPITADQLPPELHDAPPADAGVLLRLEPGRRPLPLRELRKRVEKEYIEAVLAQTGWNVSAAARLLGINRTFLHQKISELGAERPAGGDGEGD